MYYPTYYALKNLCHGGFDVFRSFDLAMLCLILEIPLGCAL